MLLTFSVFAVVFFLLIFFLGCTVAKVVKKIQENSKSPYLLAQFISQQSISFSRMCRACNFFTIESARKYLFLSLFKSFLAPFITVLFYKYLNKFLNRFRSGKQNKEAFPIGKLEKIAPLLNG